MYFETHPVCKPEIQRNLPFCKAYVPMIQKIISKILFEYIK
jgi:hypothetical protein